MQSGIKILSLNIWRYYEWERREQLILNLIGEIQPDLIFLQEAQYDERYAKVNQTELLAKLTGYSYSFFAATGVKDSQQWVMLDVPVQIGQGVISRFPLHSCESICLTRQLEDRHPRVLQHFSVEKEDKIYNFSNIHFSNRDDWAELHLWETLNMYERRKEKRIMIGDFNIKNLSGYQDLYRDNYVNSADIHDYVSYPTKNERLDYVLLPKEYNLEDFQILSGEYSDHSALNFVVFPKE